MVGEVLSLAIDLWDPWNIWYVPDEDEDPPQDDGTAVYKPLPDEECEFLPGAVWCPGESYSPGSQYHEGFMHPLCCTLEEPETTPSTTETTTLALGGYIRRPYERCEFESWVFWCPRRKYNPGWKYSKRWNQPLCCEVVEEWWSTTTTTTLAPSTASTTTLEFGGYVRRPYEKCEYVSDVVMCPGESYNPAFKFNRGATELLCCEIIESYWSSATTAPAASTSEESATAPPAPAPPAPAATKAAKPSVATAEDLMGYKAIKGEKCWHEPGAGSVRGRKFCPLPSYNVGKKYENEAGYPLCCQRMNHWYVSGKDEDVDEMADNFLANFTHVPKSVDDTPKLREPDCPDHKEFVLQKYQLNCREKTICIDKHSGRPEDKICCSTKVKDVTTALNNYNKAVRACAKVPFDSCSSSSGTSDVPLGFACDQMYWCVNKKAGAEERVGPVASASMCKDLYLIPKKTCGATKLP